MPDWIPLCVLPNVSLGSAVDSELMALAPINDPRVVACFEEQPRLSDFLGRFTTAFRAEVSPAVLIALTAAPQAIRSADAISSFRDVISASVIPRNHASAITGGGGYGIYYAEAFSIYPWMLSSDGERLVMTTPAVIGMHVVEEFHGQSSPEIAVMRLGSEDRVLQSELLERWERRYTCADPSWEDRALFRSLIGSWMHRLTPR